jgi:hypothetical protein
VAVTIELVFELMETVLTLPCIQYADRYPKKADWLAVQIKETVARETSVVARRLTVRSIVTSAWICRQIF